MNIHNNHSTSVKTNMILNGLRNVLAVLFPLISFPYISRVLGVDNIGKINVATSIVGYFALFAGLGINEYATREGAKRRSNYMELSQYVSEVYSFNMFFTILSYVGLFFLLWQIDAIQEYSLLIILQAVGIIFTTIGRQWIFQIYEEYLYITIRYIVIQVVALVSLFIFIKGPSDCIKYVIILVVANSGANVVGYLYSKKKCKIKLVFEKRIFNHLKPMLIFFAGALMVTVFTNSDNIILGLILGEHEVGLYSVAVKIYSVFVSFFTALFAVVMPRVSFLINTASQGNNYELEKILSESHDIMITLIFPTVVGGGMLSKNLIYIVSGAEYLEAANSLIIMFIALLFCVIGYFWGECVMIPHGHEKKMFWIAFCSAVTNVILNLIFIPRFGFVVAAVTTAFSQGLGTLCNLYFGNKIQRIPGKKSVVVKAGIGAGIIGVICYAMSIFYDDLIIQAVLSIIFSIPVYFLFELIVKNPAVEAIILGIKDRLNK